jgi:hypothetical protein
VGQSKPRCFDSGLDVVRHHFPLSVLDL